MCRLQAGLPAQQFLKVELLVLEQPLEKSAVAAVAHTRAMRRRIAVQLDQFVLELLVDP
jgi:hypothetical protein